MLSVPHTPQPVRPVNRRERDATTASHAAGMVACTSMPCP